MRIQEWCWKCEHGDCGHVWIAKDIVAPDQCSKCKRRGWHTKQQVIPVSPESVSSIPSPALTLEQRKAKLPASLGGLGVTTAARAEDHPEEFRGEDVEPSIAVRQPCSYSEDDRETGNVYGCSLALGHRGGHKRGDKIGEIWE